MIGALSREWPALRVFKSKWSIFWFAAV